MQSIEEKLAKSLTAETTELIAYLPYLLQDLWDLGSSYQDMKTLIAKNIIQDKPLTILDLACGKGAVSVKLALEIDCVVKGIDIMPEFIAYAKKKAIEYDVSNRCSFVVGDITKAIDQEKNFDIVILGAAGDVLGNPQRTIALLKKTVKKNSYIIIDDAYVKSDKHKDYYTKNQWLQFFVDEGVELVDELPFNEEELHAVNQYQQPLIAKRANELKQKYPDKAHLFDAYVKSQQEECDVLEHDLICVTFLLKLK